MNNKKYKLALAIFVVIFNLSYLTQSFAADDKKKKTEDEESVIDEQADEDLSIEDAEYGDEASEE